MDYNIGTPEPSSNLGRAALEMFYRITSNVVVLNISYKKIVLKPWSVSLKVKQDPQKSSMMYRKHHKSLLVKC